MNIFSKKGTLVLSLLFSSLNIAYASCPVEIGTIKYQEPSDSSTKIFYDSGPTVYPTASYWKECYASVKIHSFGGQAAERWDLLRTNYNQVYHVSILEAMNKASEQKIATLQGNYQALIQIVNENYVALNKANIQMKTTMLEQELDFQRDLQEKKMNEKSHGMFNDGNGEGGIVRSDTQSYKYFKEMCKRNKMFAKTSGQVYSQKRSDAVNKRVTAQSKKMIEITGSTNEIANAVVQNHASEYCSANDIKYNICVNPDLKLCVDDDVESGVCLIEDNEVFKLTNLDTDSINLLRPDGYNGRYSFDGVELEEPKNRIEDELFDIDYTYTDEQAEAAKSFASLLIYQPAVKAPTLAEKNDPTNSDFVDQYNRYLSSLNLSNYSFENAIEARKKLDIEGEIPMSERDVLRYLIHSFGNPDALVAAKSGKDLSSETMIYQLMTIKNKLELEEFKQKERIENLLAALLSAQANDPDLIKKLNSLK